MGRKRWRRKRWRRKRRRVWRRDCDGRERYRK